MQYVNVNDIFKLFIFYALFLGFIPLLGMIGIVRIHHFYFTRCKHNGNNKIAQVLGIPAYQCCQFSMVIHSLLF